MVFPGRGIRLGSSLFTNRQAQFFVAGVRQGLTRAGLRTVFRDEFNRGFSDNAFTAARQFLTESERAGVAFNRLSGAQRLDVSRIPSISVQATRHRFLVSARVTARIPRTGQVIERFVRFGADEPPSKDEFLARAQEILDLGVAQADSAMQLDNVEGISLVQAG